MLGTGFPKWKQGLAGAKKMLLGDSRGMMPELLGKKHESELRLPRAGQPDPRNMSTENECFLAAVTKAWERQRRRRGISEGQLHPGPPCMWRPEFKTGYLSQSLFTLISKLVVSPTELLYSVSLDGQQATVIYLHQGLKMCATLSGFSLGFWGS